MDNDTVTSKDALFMLDTDMEQDMKAYGEEITNLAIKHINSTPELYNRMKATKEQGASMHITARWWAEEHKDEFGQLFITELEMVDWNKVERMV